MERQNSGWSTGAPELRSTGAPDGAPELRTAYKRPQMETEIRASKAGTIGSVNVKEGDSVAVGDTLLTIA